MGSIACGGRERWSQGDVISFVCACAGSGLDQESLQVIMHKHNYFLGFNNMLDVVEGANYRWSLP